MPSSLSQLAIQQFLEHMEVERNVSPLTLRNYGQYLRRFNEWLLSKNIKDLKNVDQEIMREYRVYLSRVADEHGQTLAKKTQGYYIIALRSMLKWLIKNDVPVLNPEKLDLPKAESRNMRFLNVEQVERLLSQPDLSKPGGLRDRAMMEVLFSTGLRVSELVSLNRDQVDLERKEFGVIGKGRRPRVVFLSDRAVVWLERWFSTRTDQWRPVFTRLSGKQDNPILDGEDMRLTTRSVQRLLEGYCRHAHLPFKITPHGLRHSFATDLLSNGASLRDVQEMLGHKNIATTQIYTHVTRPELRKVHGKFHSKM